MARNRKKAPWFPMFPVDFHGDFRVRRMSADAQAFYALLLINMWDTKTQFSVPDDDVGIARLLGLPLERWQRLRAEMMPKKDPIFRRCNGCLVSDRLRREKRKWDKYQESQAEKGRRSAQQRLNRGSTAVDDKVPPATPEEATKLSNLLADLILEHNPNSPQLRPRKREVTVRRWAVEFDRLHRLDGQSWESIGKVVEWCQKDAFWHKVILSAASLRKHWEKLAMGALNPKGTWRDKFKRL